MSKTLFIQQLTYDYLGTMVLIAYLKKHGHEASLYISSSSNGILQKIKESGPTIVGFSVMTGGQAWVHTQARLIKKHFPEIHIVVGGAHATFFPEDLLTNEAIDSVCIGEGEGAMLDLANALERGTPVKGIQNLSLKIDGEIFKAPLRPLIIDLDTLPFPDRSHYEEYPLLRNSPWKSINSGRGCPFQCSFCFNESYNALYGAKGPTLIRKRSPENICAEINKIQKNWPLKEVHFWDDAFNANKTWLNLFCETYPKLSTLPFRGDLRIDITSEDEIKNLKSAGCKTVMFGLESGSETLRRTVLGKPISDKQIIEGARLLKKYQIPFGTFNILGLPGESLKDAFKTIELNQKIETDFPWCSIAQPYPNTKLYELSKAQGLLPQNKDVEYPISFFDKSILKQKGLKEVARLQKVFYFCVKSKTFYALIKRVIKIPLSPLYFFLFATSQVLRHKKIYSMSFYEVSLFCLGMVKSYFK